MKSEGQPDRARPSLRDAGGGPGGARLPPDSPSARSRCRAGARSRARSSMPPRATVRFRRSCSRTPAGRCGSTSSSGRSASWAPATPCSSSITSAPDAWGRTARSFDRERDRVRPGRRGRPCGTCARGRSWTGRRIVQMGLSYGAMAGLRAASESFRAKHLGWGALRGDRQPLPVVQPAGAGPLTGTISGTSTTTPTSPCWCCWAPTMTRRTRARASTRPGENAARGMPVEFAVFPGTTHAFDHSLMGDKPVVAAAGGPDGHLPVQSRRGRGGLESGPSDFLARHRRRRRQRADDRPSPPMARDPAVFAPAGAADESKEAWDALVGGGHVALIRHGNAPGPSLG